MNKEQILHRLNLISIQLLKENYRSAKQLVDDAFYQLSTGPTWKNLSEGFGMEGAPKVKRYCLVIPDPMPKKWLPYTLIHALDGKEVERVKSDGSDASIMLGGLPCGVPKSWLVEIKEKEPYKSPRCWLDDKYPGSMPAHNYSHAALMNAFIDGRADYELRHRETESMQDAIKKAKVGQTKPYGRGWNDGAQFGWQAHEKSRGYE